MKKKLIALTCLATIGLSSAGLSFADNSNQTSGTLVLDSAQTKSVTQSVGGGLWVYDTWIDYRGKAASSDYGHDTNYHSSYVEIGTKKDPSGRTRPGIAAEALVTGGNVAKKAIVKWNNQA